MYIHTADTCPLRRGSVLFLSKERKLCRLILNAFIAIDTIHICIHIYVVRHAHKREIMV